MKSSKKKLRVAVVFGGRSAEHEVSLVSATSIIQALDKRKYKVVLVGIAPDGKWISGRDVLRRLKSRRIPATLPEYTLLPDQRFGGLVRIGRGGQSPAAIPIDVIIPVLHGTYGEDGTVQGLFELAGIPYVGAGVLGSSIGMDKVVTKQLCVLEKIPVAPYLSFGAGDYRKNRNSILALIERRLRYPLFVKPANSGSSVGISKVYSRKDLVKAIDLALTYDIKILVERSIENGREIETSVLGNDDPIASVPGEVLSSNEFYDYDAKYVDGKSTTIVPADLSAAVARRLQLYAVKAFRAVNCSGMARVDFLVERKSGKIYFNEINTIPGFTSISMYPKLWEASGIPYPKLLDRLIDLAIKRHKGRQGLKTIYRPKSHWYKD